MPSARFKPNGACPRACEAGYSSRMGRWTTGVVMIGLCACSGKGMAPEGGQPTTVTAEANMPVPTPFVSPYSYEQFLRAELALGRGDFDTAVAAYARTLSSADPDPYLRTRYAEALVLAGHPAEAMHTLQEGLEDRPRSAVLLRSLGQLEAQQGQLQAALAHLEQAEAIVPYDEELTLSLAQVLREAGAEERALSVLQRFAARMPAARPLATRAEVRLALQTGDLDRALHGTRDLVRHGPWPATARMVEETAAALLARGRALSAAELLLLLPESEADLSLRLKALLAAQLRDEAADLLLGAPSEQLGAFPAVPQAMLRVGLPGRALEEAERILLTSGENPVDTARAQLIRAQALLALHEPQEAAAALGQVDMSVSDSVPPLQAQRRQVLEALLRSQAMPTLANELATRPVTPAAPR